VLADVHIFNLNDYEKVAHQFPAPVISPDGPHYGTMSHITQIVTELKKLPEPYADLALSALQEHWDEISKLPDPLSDRHRYPTGMLSHLWSLLNILRYVFQKSDPVQAMKDIVRQFQREQELSESSVTGMEGASAILPVSLDYLNDIVRKTKIAMDYALEDPIYTTCVVGAVFREIGKLVSEPEVSPNAYGAECLVTSAKRLGVPFEDVAAVHEVVAVEPNFNATYPYLPDAWVLLFTTYLADSIG
jgi:hypothetical protein